MKQCFVCGKKASTGNKVSHSNRKSRRMWNPNLQRIRIIVAGKSAREYVCTKCMKAGKVTKAPV